MPMLSNEAYLNTILRDKKLQLEVLHVKNQVDVAIYNTKKEALISDISSLEKQLGEK